MPIRPPHGRVGEPLAQTHRVIVTAIRKMYDAGMEPSPTVSPESPLASVMARNIKALLDVRREEVRTRTFQERCVDAVSEFAGSMGFIALHAVLAVLWLLANTRHLPGIKVWDPYPFNALSLTVSLEAILLSSFVLMGQKRQSLEENRRDELDLHINLLAEHEVTRVVEMLEMVCRKLDIEPRVDDLAEIERDVAPETVMRQIDQHLRKESEGN